MRRIVIIIFATIVAMLFASCESSEDKEMQLLLSQWDALLEEHPEAIADSLKTIDPNDLSRENRAYYNLLKTISDDKTYFEFKNDSLINRVVDYYQLHEPYGNKYIRALTYKGIVRTRMGITDSTAYEPLKKADNIFHTQKNPDPAIGYILHYFLGDTHFSNASYELAGKYFEETLAHAKLKNDSTHILDSYLALFWNEMAQSKKISAASYLDTLLMFYEKIPEKKYFIINAQAVYNESIGNYLKALEYTKEQFSLLSAQKDILDYSNILYNISFKYLNLNQLDSAMLYGQIAIDGIVDYKKQGNYLLYENVANIAEKQNNYPLANTYRQKAFELYEKSVNDRLDTQVMELEKKYDLSEAENVALRSRQSTLSIAIVALLLAMLVTILIMLNLRNRRRARIKLMKLEHEAETRAIETKLLEEEANKRNWLIQLYGYISNRLTSLQENFDTLSQRYVSSNPKVYENMHNILHSTEADLRDIPKTLVPDENTFSLYTNLSKEDAELFNTNEKIMLMLLICKADNKQISTFMNTSIESTRARKSQLKKKMVENRIDTSDFFNF